MGRHAALQISEAHAPARRAELTATARASRRDHLTVVPGLVGRHRRPDDEDCDPVHQPVKPEPARTPPTPARAGGPGLGWPESTTIGRMPGSVPDHVRSAPLGWPALPWAPAVPRPEQPRSVAVASVPRRTLPETRRIEQRGWRRMAGRLRHERNHGVVAVVVACLAAATAVRGLTTLRR